MPQERKTPYTEHGIKRQKCFRCGLPARTQWQICADNNTYRPLCIPCDVELNELVLEWVGDSQCDSKADAYRKKLQERYGEDYDKAFELKRAQNKEGN